MRLTIIKKNCIPERTFHNHIEAIADTFGIEIKCDRSLGYYIANSDDLWGNGIRNWLLQSLSLNNLLNESTQMWEHILFERIPSSQHFLTMITEAMRDGTTIEITYQGLNKDSATTFEALPYCLKLFKQRWYMVARSAASEKPWIYSLDRIKHIEPTKHSYKIPKSFNAEDFFKNLYGICVEDWKKAEDVEIKVDKSQVNYYKSLPLHPSQEEIETTEQYTVFRYHIVPTYDFTQELLSKANSVEILKPTWYRNEIKHTIRQMLKIYDKEEEE